MIFGLRYPRACRIPFLFELFLVFFQPHFFGAQHCPIVASILPIAVAIAAVSSLMEASCWTKRGFAALQIGLLFLQALGDRFRRRHAFIHGGQFSSGGRQFSCSVCTHRASCATSSASRALSASASARLVAAVSCCILARMRPLLCVLNFLAHARQFALAKRSVPAPAVPVHFASARDDVLRRTGCARLRDAARSILRGPVRRRATP